VLPYFRPSATNILSINYSSMSTLISLPPKIVVGNGLLDDSPSNSPTGPFQGQTAPSHCL